MSDNSPLSPSDVLSYLVERQANFVQSVRTKGLDLPSASFLRDSVRKIGDNLLALDSDPDEDVGIDTAEMRADFTITTPRKDRYGDVVLPRGCEPHLANYTKNPQVFFSHKSSDLPIAQARDKSGKLSLSIFDDKIRSSVYFHEETEEARTVWRMVVAGILRATSIGFIPVRGAIMRSDDEEDGPRKTPEGEKIIDFGGWMPLKFLEWDLIEYSIVPIPANPDCVDSLTAVLSRGFIEGQRIPASIRRSLEPYALKAKVWSPGFDPAKVKYSGVLKMGEVDIEYKDGAIVKLGEHVLGPSETPEEVAETLTSLVTGPKSADDAYKVDLLAGATTLNERREAQGLEPLIVVDPVKFTTVTETPANVVEASCDEPVHPMDEPDEGPGEGPDNDQEIHKKLDELLKCHSAAMEHREKCHKELMSCHKELVDAIKSLAPKAAPAPETKTVEPPKPAPPPVPAVDKESFDKLAEVLVGMVGRQKKMSERLFSLTGVRVD